MHLLLWQNFSCWCSFFFKHWQNLWKSQWITSVKLYMFIPFLIILTHFVVTWEFWKWSNESFLFHIWMQVDWKCFFPPYCAVKLLAFKTQWNSCHRYMLHSCIEVWQFTVCYLPNAVDCFLIRVKGRREYCLFYPVSFGVSYAWSYWFTYVSKPTSHMIYTVKIKIFDQIHQEEETLRSLGTVCWNGCLAVCPGTKLWTTRTRSETSKYGMSLFSCRLWFSHSSHSLKCGTCVTPLCVCVFVCMHACMLCETYACAFVCVRLPQHLFY